MNSKTRPCFWFEKGGLEAARFYTTLLPDSFVEDENWPGEDEPIIVNFTLTGTPYQIINGGPHYKLSPAASISVTTATSWERAGSRKRAMVWARSPSPSNQAER